MLALTGMAAAFAALALGAAFVAVSDDPEAAPQLGAPTSDDWAIVTGTQSLIGESPDCALTGINVLPSDPRLEGDVCIDYEVVDGESVAAMWSSITITNANGSWQGQSVGFADERGAHHHMSWFEGDGAYEGLAFIQQLTEAEPKYPSAGVNLDMVGLIYAGELPPMVTPDWAANPPMDAE